MCDGRNQKYFAIVMVSTICRPCKQRCAPVATMACPFLWALSSSGTVCVAPFSYLGMLSLQKCNKEKFSFFPKNLGPCSPVQSSTKPKDEFMSQCRVTYDCEASSIRVEEDICERDYELPCPRGWTLEHHSRGSFCRAGKGYSGRCAWRFPFGEYTQKMKKAVARTCDVRLLC